MGTADNRENEQRIEPAWSRRTRTWNPLGGLGFRRFQGVRGAAICLEEADPDPGGGIYPQPFLHATPRASAHRVIYDEGWQANLGVSGGDSSTETGQNVAADSVPALELLAFSAFDLQGGNINRNMTQCGLTERGWYRRRVDGSSDAVEYGCWSGVQHGFVSSAVRARVCNLGTTFQP